MNSINLITDFRKHYSHEYMADSRFIFDFIEKTSFFPLSCFRTSETVYCYLQDALYHF